MVISANGVKYSWEYLRSFLGSINIFMKEIFFLIQGAYIYNFADKTHSFQLRIVSKKLKQR